MEVKSHSPYPDILRSEGYRDFLRDFFAYKKSLRDGFSYRQFASIVGLKSPNYLQLVIQGKRNLSETTARRISEALKIKSKESEYFVALVQKENAETSEDLNKALKNLFRAARNLKARFIDQEQKIILSEWYHFAVRELVCMKDFEPSGAYISKKLGGVISEEAAEESFRLLLSSGFLKFSDGRYQQTDPVLDTGTDLFKHSFMQKYHARLLKSWSENLSNLDAKGQELGVINIPLPASKIPELQ